MDKNTIIGFVLMIAVVIGFSWFTQPSAEEIQAQQRYNDSIAAVEAAKALELAAWQEQADAQAQAAMANIEVDSLTADSLHRAEMFAQYGAFATVAEGEEQTITLENNVVALEFSSRGGYLRKATLKDYKNYTGEDTTNVVLFQENDNRYGFIFKTGARVIDTQSLYFTPTATDSTVDMTLNLMGGAKWNVRYTLPEDSYRLQMEITQNGMEKVIPQNIVNLDMYWDLKMPRQEKGRMFEQTNSALYYKHVGDDVDKLGEKGDKDKYVKTSLKWIGYKDQFFTSAFIADNNFNEAFLVSEDLEKDPKYLKKFHSEALIDYTSSNAQVGNFSLFLGPNDYKLFRSYDKGVDKENRLDLDRVIPLGWPLFRWINTLIIINVFDFLSKFISNYGLIIFLLTIFIKLILFPFTYKSYKSQAKMRVIQPQMQALNEKYPNPEDAMKKQNAMMELYSKAGVNPMGGCLPMLLQMPILVAMFSFFPSSIELRGESFLWAKDLSSYDAIVEWDTYIPLISSTFGNHISLFCLLMTITNILYTKVTMDQSGQNAMPGMKWMMYLMPLMFLFFFNNYASGLSYYYFLSLLITIIQTWAFRKLVDEKKVLAQMEANAKKPRKKSGFMARLEEAQRQQEALLREQRKQQAKHNGKGRQ
ncbi:MAG: membrane protein insertase YidC [Bacteroidaceae bacterium]|nr:membrane protein insertase YidC [Bacteroidaceae bacterium]